MKTQAQPKNPGLSGRQASVITAAHAACLDNPAGRRRLVLDQRIVPPGRAGLAIIFHVLVQKMRQALTFLATIKNHDPAMRTLAVISILALLTISGAVYTDQLLTSGHSMHEAN